jgi:hypothetical protein
MLGLVGMEVNTTVQEDQMAKLSKSTPPTAFQAPRHDTPITLHLTVQALFEEKVALLR